MRALFLLVFALAIPAAQARVSLQTINKTVISGSDYVRLEDLADAYSYSMKWSKALGTVAITGATGRVGLTIDSRRAEIAGVDVWLSLPVVNRSGVAYVSVADVNSTLSPLLFPHKLDGTVHTICLDPGHGGKDKGTIDGSNYEKNYTLLLAQEVEKLLQGAGFKVVLTRHDDTFIDLPARPLDARRRDADIFVSMHYNSGDRNIRGVEVYCLAPAGMNSSNEGGGRAPFLRMAGNAHDAQNVLLAQKLQHAIVADAGMQDRGMKRARFEVLREATIPAVLIEGGFMSNPADAKNVYDLNFRKRMAQSIVDGIIAYKKTVEKPAPVHPEPPPHPVAKPAPAPAQAD